MLRLWRWLPCIALLSLLLHALSLLLARRSAPTSAGLDWDVASFDAAQPAHLAGPRHDFVIATRFWVTMPSDAQRVQDFVRRALQVADHVLVGVRAERDDGATAAALHGIASPAQLTVLPITPWHVYTSALNALLLHAAGKLRARLLMFHSVEVHAPARAYACLRHAVAEDPGVLVAGLALPNAHAFTPGPHRMTGMASPWNTAAVWNVTKLASPPVRSSVQAQRGCCSHMHVPAPAQLRTGFAPVSDGLLPGTRMGIEEVPAASLQQLLSAMRPPPRPRHEAAAVLLLRAEGVQWRVADGLPAGRLAKHAAKLATKDERAAAQLRAMGVPAGSVLHAECALPRPEAVGLRGAGVEVVNEAHAQR